MQLKTIQKTISSKMEDWLKTVSDENLKKLLRSNILVSGGSITSMLLGEPVNDFDVYIKSKDVLLKLCEYYCAKFPDITILNGEKKNEYQSDLEKKYNGIDEQDIHSAYSIAIRTLKEDQVKLYFQTSKGGMKVNELMNPDDFNYSPLFFSPNAISLSNDLQIVIRFYGDSKKVHETFDFIHATNYFTFDEGLVTNKEALESILTKQLKYQGSLYPVTSIIRMKKFIKRNFNISAGEILKIVFQISELDLKNPDVLEEQLIGVDVAYFSKLIEILRGVKDEKMTSKYLNEIIDRVFNDLNN